MRILGALAVALSVVAFANLPGSGGADTTVASAQPATEGVVEFRLLAAGAASDAAVAPDAMGFVANGRWGDNAMPVPVRYNFATDPANVTAFGATLWAMRQWETIGGQKLRFRYGGATTSTPEGPCTDRSRDGVNSVTFARLNPNTLGTTCVYFAIVPGTQVRRILEFDLELTNEVKWSLAATTPADAFDLPSTLLHELGHAAGLGHTPVMGAVMVETLAPGDQFRVPAADDREGILSLYADPVSGPATPPVAPMALPPARYETRRLPGIAHD